MIAIKFYCTCFTLICLVVSGGRLRVRLVIVNMISRYGFEFEEIIALS